MKLSTSKALNKLDKKHANFLIAHATKMSEYYHAKLRNAYRDADHFLSGYLCCLMNCGLITKIEATQLYDDLVKTVKEETL